MLIDWNVPEVQPRSCDPDVFLKGTYVAVLHQGQGRMWHVQALIDEVARLTGTVGKTDWDYCGGRAVVRTLGDVDKVREALIQVWPQFVARFTEAQIRS